MQRKSKHTFFLCSVTFFFSKNVEKHIRAGQATDNNMAHAHCTLHTKATKIHLEYTIVAAFPLQHWFPKCDSMFRYSTLPVLLHSASNFHFQLDTHVNMYTGCLFHVSTVVLSLCRYSYLRVDVRVSATCKYGWQPIAVI